MAYSGSTAGAGVPKNLLPRFSSLSTGFKLFLILSLALLPLGLIAFLATVQSSRTADLENAAQMRIALDESSRKLGSTFAADISTVRGAMEALAAGRDNVSLCTELSGIIATRGQTAFRLALFGPGSRPVCNTRGFIPLRPSTLSLVGSPVPTFAIVDDRLEMTVPSPGGSQIAVISYAPRVLSAIGAPGGLTPAYSLSLITPNEMLPIMSPAAGRTIAGRETLTSSLGIGDLSVELIVARSPFSTAEILAILLPLLMWAAAATIGWLVVDQLLIRPMRRLERQVAAYQPGQIIAPLDDPNSAHELQRLGHAFHKITETIATHDSALAEGLARQTRLTREVHHRVKNNLQVVASLINLHARGDQAVDAARAYASIQRRVDALAVVHRNHYAELEENRGVQLRALIGELAQNLRSSVPEGQPSPAISIDVSPLHVSQDVAVPVAFLITELVELAMLCDPAARITILLKAEDEGKARLAVASPAFVDTPLLASRLDDRFGRVLEGLSRQLRSPLDRSPHDGRFSLHISISGTEII